MSVLRNFDPAGFGGALASLSCAFVLGGLIGLERQYRQRTAGLRTNVLVATGAAAFVDLGVRVNDAHGATQIIAYVVSGIGFLGAGVIMKEGAQVRGLNTAATLWASGAVGAAAGAGFFAEAGALAAFVVAGNTLLRPLVNFVNRLPVSAASTEAHYAVHVVCRAEDVSEARDLLFQEIERANYPVRDIEILSESEETVELAASLIPTSADSVELDAVVVALEQAEVIESATWTVSTTT
ncbi:MAG: MgtC/SapB family protein [Caulobacteraceae bacterium]